MTTQFAFRCKQCGRLHTSDHAAEAPHPHACSVCGGGVIFKHQELADELDAALEAGDKDRAKELVAQIRGCDPAAKKLLPDNWEVLADAEPERLKELGLEPEHAVKHAAWSKEDGIERDPVHLTREAAEANATSNGPAAAKA